MKKNILIVDDDFNMIRLITYNLNKNGYEIFSAGNGKEAWKILLELPIDLVITDLEMPEMDGYELCRKIHSNPDLKKVPIIVVTCKTKPEDLEKSFACGIKEFITKPFNPKELIKTVGEILNEN